MTQDREIFALHFLRAKCVVHLVLLMFLIVAQQTAIAKDSLLDPGTLQSVETINGKTIEKYSDGLIVEVGEDGSISEESVRDRTSMSSTLPSRERYHEIVDGDISMLLDFAYMHDGQVPNGSRQQSRLRQFSSYYLAMNEPGKAEPLAKRYLHIQQVLKVIGEPIAHGQLTLGEAELALGKFQDAIPLLDAASNFYEHSSERLIYCTVLNELSEGLLNAKRPAEALVKLELCQKLCRDNDLGSIKKKVAENYERARREATKHISH